MSILDLKQGLVSGVEVSDIHALPTHKEDYFNWSEWALTARFRSSDVSGGVLKCWHHTPSFTQIESHADKELFYFVSGTAIMLFMDIVDGAPKEDTAQIVRIKPGTLIVIDVGKGHFVAVAEGDEPVIAIVVSPKMEAPRLTLKAPVAVD